MNDKKNEIKCKCKTWYPNPEFNNLCSECFSINYPEKWKEFQEKKGCNYCFISLEQLNRFVSDNTVLFPGCQWSMLLRSIKDRDDFNSLITIINYVKRNSNDFLGITSEQSVELYNVFKRFHGYKYEGSFGSNKDWKWQHLFAGMVFDKWNIKKEQNGSIAYCYYGNFGKKPRELISKEKWVSPWMSSNEKDRKFWLDNLPENFSNFLK